MVRGLKTSKEHIYRDPTVSLERASRMENGGL